MKKIIEIALIALTALSFVSCGEKPKPGGEELSGPTILSEAHIYFISRLNASTLFSGASDIDAVGKYVGDLYKNNATLVFLDRTDMSGIKGVNTIALSNYKWTASAFNKQVSRTDMQGGTILFAEPTRLVGNAIVNGGSNVTYMASPLNGTITNKDAEGNVTGVKEVVSTANYYTARFDASAQIDAFCGTSGVFNTLKNKVKNLLFIGTVSNGLFESLSKGVVAADSAYKVEELAKGPEFTVFMIAGTRFWELNGVSSNDVVSGIKCYDINVKWK